MMTVGAQSVARVKPGEELWVTVLIAAGSASMATLFFYHPSLLAAVVLVSLTLAAFVRFDYFVYGSIFLLPWCPLVDVNLPVRDVFLVLRFVLFVGVWIRLRERGQSVHKWLVGSKRKKGIALFGGITIVSVLLSGVPGNLNSYRAVVLLTSYIAFFFAIDGWLESRHQLVLVLKLLLLSTIGVALFGFYQAVSGSYTDLYFRLYPLQEAALEPWEGRITSLLFQFNSTAGYLNLVIPVAIACAVLEKDRVLKFLGLSCTCTAAVAIFLTQSRGGLMALFGILIIAAWVLVPRLITRFKLLCGSAVACILLLPLLFNHFERLQGIDDATQLSRIALWQGAASMFLQHPFLGVGYGNYKFLISAFVPGTELDKLDAHNLYLQLLAETGLIGFLCFGAILGAFLFLSLKSVRRQDTLYRIIAFGVCGAIASTLIHGTVDFLFIVSPQFGVLFWLVLGLGSRVMLGSSSKMVTKAATP